MLDLLRSENAAVATLRFDYDTIDAGCREQVRNAALEIQIKTKRAQESILAIGNRLSEIKALLPHGQFQEWVQAEFDMSPRSAQRLMSVSDRFAGKSDTVSLFTDSALYLLSAPSTPDAAVEEAVGEARGSGVSPTKARVKQIIDKHTVGRAAVGNREDAQGENGANGDHRQFDTQRAATDAIVDTWGNGESDSREGDPVVDAITVDSVRSELAGELNGIIGRLSIACGDIERTKTLLGLDAITIAERARSHTQILIDRLRKLKEEEL